MDACNKLSSSCSGKTGTTHRKFDIFSSSAANLMWGKSGSRMSSLLGVSVEFSEVKLIGKFCARKRF